MTSVYVDAYDLVAFGDGDLVWQLSEGGWKAYKEEVDDDNKVYQTNDFTMPYDFELKAAEVAAEHKDDCIHGYAPGECKTCAAEDAGDCRFHEGREEGRW